MNTDKIIKTHTILDEVKNWLDYRNFEEVSEKTSLKELQEHGCISGMISDLIYYYDTNRFYNKHRQEIFKLVDEFCSETGENLNDFLTHANNFPLDKKEINSYSFCNGISGLIKKFSDEAEQIKNWFAWFGFEETAYRYYSEKYEN